jgi:ribosomal-protein-alanine N-acetyltransferase
MSNIVLQSERLLFREFTHDDAPLIYSLNIHPEVVRYVHELPVTDLASAEENLARVLSQYRQYGYGRWALFTKDQNEFIGWCGLKFRPERNETDLGYRLIPTYWGKGYATEASLATIAYGFNTLQLPTITAMAHTENKASLHVLEKIGMQFIGYETVDNCPVKTWLLSNPASTTE